MTLLKKVKKQCVQQVDSFWQFVITQGGHQNVVRTAALLAYFFAITTISRHPYFVRVHKPGQMEHTIK